MLKVGGWRLLSTILNFNVARAHILSLDWASHPTPTMIKAVAEATRDAAKEFLELADEQQLPLSATLRAQLTRLYQESEVASTVASLGILDTLLDEAVMNNAVELDTHIFILVPSEERELFEDPVSRFGEATVAALGDISADVASAGRCLTLNEPTSAVFHLMRILERGLHALARNLQVTMAATIELQNWHNIIEQIESAIRKERNDLRKVVRGSVPSDSTEADARLQGLSDIAAEFGYIKGFLTQMYARFWNDLADHASA